MEAMERQLPRPPPRAAVELVPLDKGSTRRGGQDYSVPPQGFINESL